MTPRDGSARTESVSTAGDASASSSSSRASAMSCSRRLGSGSRHRWSRRRMPAGVASGRARQSAAARESPPWRRKGHLLGRRAPSAFRTARTRTPGCPSALSIAALALALPKSSTVTVPAGVTVMLAGFRSRMDDALGVCGLEHVRNLAGDGERLANVDGRLAEPAPRDPLRQRDGGDGAGRVRRHPIQLVRAPIPTIYWELGGTLALSASNQCWTTINWAGGPSLIIRNRWPSGDTS